jgi:hypothetical protein
MTGPLEWLMPNVHYSVTQNLNNQKIKVIAISVLTPKKDLMLLFKTHMFLVKKWK